MLSATVVPMASNDSDASVGEWSDVWRCTITIKDSEITTRYSNNGTDLEEMEPVSGNNGDAKVGSWGFDDTTGYGPFGSFYAAVDVSTGQIYKHLNPKNLALTMDNENVNNDKYNIMWVLPKVWMKVTDVITENGKKIGSTLIMSSEKESDDMEAPAHTIDGIIYNYLAIGVYEAWVDDGVAENERKVYSFANKSPTVSSILNFEPYAKRTGAEEGHSMLWNYYQYQLYRFCSLAVMENFDSQAQIGWGNAFPWKSGSISNTGTTITEGPYYGTTAADASGERLFIENAWGNVWDYVGDTIWNGGIYAGQRSEQDSSLKSLVHEEYQTTVKNSLQGLGIAPYSTVLDSWGLPTDVGRGGPDKFVSCNSGFALVVGGRWCDGSDAGLSFLCNGDRAGQGDMYGSRLAMVFGVDPASEHTATFDTRGGEGDFPTLTLHEGEQFNMPSIAPVMIGSAFGGWSDGKQVYGAGAEVTMGTKSMKFYAVWTEANKVTYHLDGGTGEVPPDMYVPEGLEFTVSNVVPIRAGYAFVGWSDGSITHDPGTKMIMGGTDITLTAVWTKSSAVIPIFPEDEETIEVIVDDKQGSRTGDDGKTVLLIAIAVAIIAELIVLCVVRKR